MKVLVIQVAGLLARRIVSWVTLGHQLVQGECYGMIKFGSSTELVLPKNVEILVKKEMPSQAVNPLSGGFWTDGIPSYNT